MEDNGEGQGPRARLARLWRGERRATSNEQRATAEDDDEDEDDFALIA
jgi:hypothetical protein